jgi:hypothetical protein
MKNQILRNTAILGLFFMLAMTSANAQTASEVKVNIPFDFSTGKATLKAGSYTIKRTSGSVMAIRSTDGKRTALVNAPLTVGARDSKAGERLMFNKYGDKYFLSQVWLSVDTGRQLFTSGAETKAARDYRLANNNAKPQRIEVAVQSR